MKGSKEMRLKSLMLTASLALLISACGANSKQPETVTSNEATKQAQTEAEQESTSNVAVASAINTKSVSTPVTTVASKSAVNFESVDETVYVKKVMHTL